MCRTFILSALILLISFSLAAQTPEDDFRAIRRDLVTNIASLRLGVLKGLSPQEREFERGITYTVPLEDDVNGAYSTIDGDGRMVVAITVGFGRSLDMLVDAMIMSKIYNEPGFFDEYVEYVIRATDSNVKRMRNGLRPKFIHSPYTYRHWNDQQIDRFSAQNGLLHNKILTSALAVVLAHEIAHQYYGDTRTKRKSLADARMREQRADDWAMQRVINAHILPIGAMVPLMYYMHLDEDAIAHEDERSHPADLRRLRGAFAATLAALDAFSGDLAAAGMSLSETKKQFATAISQMDEDIADEESTRKH